MTINVQEETEGKSDFGYPNKNAVLLTMLSYGKAALYEIFRPSLNGITYYELAKLHMFVAVNFETSSNMVFAKTPLNLHVQLPQHHCQTVDYCLFHFRYPKNYYPLNQTF